MIERDGEGFDTITTFVHYTLPQGSFVERILAVSSSNSLTLVGNELNQTIIGNSMHNVLNGLGGSDRLEGGFGDDYHIVDADDTVIELAGQGYDTVAAHTSHQLTIGSAIEALVTTFETGSAPITLLGNAFAQSIRGNAGNNIINGLGGADVLSGLGGDDYYVVDGDDVVYEAEGAGNDIVAALTTYRLTGGSAVELLVAADQSGNAAMNLIGNELAQQMIGNAGDNILNGLGGADVMSGLGGNDYYVIEGDDIVYESAGNGYDIIASRVSHVLAGGSHVEMLVTADEVGTFAIDLTGNERGQTIWGNAGANRIDGGHGADTLRGLGGADTFVFSTGLGNGNIDSILDFAAGLDKIAIDDVVFADMAVGALAAGAFRIGTAAADADDRIIYDSATGALLFDADGSGAGAAVQFATLSAGLNLSAGDFIVI